MEVVNHQEAFSYLMLWNCVIFACVKAPVALRSVYTAWLCGNKYKEVFMNYFHIIENKDLQYVNCKRLSIYLLGNIHIVSIMYGKHKMNIDSSCF